MIEHPILIAYTFSPTVPEMRIEPAACQRDWMDETPHGFAKRCLPLLIANQSGWHILNTHAVRVTWDGGVDKSAVHIVSDYSSGYAVSHFGSGIVTWSFPYLFRTSPGYNLLVRGPANFPKDGISALEGVVESDWTCSTFTMNWKLTRPGLPVCFDVGEPICFLVPQRRGELESITPEMRFLADAPEVQDVYDSWSNERALFLSELQMPGSQARMVGWQKDYFQGRGIKEHQTKLSLSPVQCKIGDENT